MAMSGLPMSLSSTPVPRRRLRWLILSMPSYTLELLCRGFVVMEC